MIKIRDLLRLPFLMMVNPARGFSEMKFEGRGKIAHIPILFFLMCISFSFQRQYVGFALLQPFPLGFNILFDFTLVFLAFMLFCVGNWSVTCLMDGSGKLAEIMMSVAYSFTPMILIFIPATLVSNFITLDEGGFYYMVIGVSVFWFLLMLFTALIIIHEYSLARTAATVFLTILSILAIVFILGLIASLIQQMVMFFYAIYNELIFRL